MHHPEIILPRASYGVLKMYYFWYSSAELVSTHVVPTVHLPECVLKVYNIHYTSQFRWISTPALSCTSYFALGSNENGRFSVS